MELVILCGLQASGKSTFRRELLADHLVVSKDLMRSHSGREARQLRLIAAALGDGGSVVVDNTNPGRADRAPLIALGREYGATISGYFFESDFDVCLARNDRREGTALVPFVGVAQTAARLEPPTVEEGFDRLFFVRIDGDQFVIESMETDDRA
jgi:predicted kinase